MSVNWNWKNKMGELTVFNGKEKYKINMYAGNCLAALIYDKGNQYIFWGFWNDIKHLERNLGFSKGYSNDNLYNNPSCKVIKVKVNTYYKDMEKVACLFAKTGVKVELYYRDPLDNLHYEVIDSTSNNKRIIWDTRRIVCSNWIKERDKQYWKGKYRIIKVLRKEDR